MTGFLEQRRFEEGADVAAGDLLFVLEKEPLQAVVAQRQAELASAEANKANTAAQLTRGEQLVKNGNIPRSEVDMRRADDQMAAAVDSGGAGGAPGGADQPRLHRHPGTDRGPDRPRRRSASATWSGPTAACSRPSSARTRSTSPSRSASASCWSTVGSIAAKARPVVRVDAAERHAATSMPGKLDFLDVQVDQTPTP